MPGTCTCRPCGAARGACSVRRACGQCAAPSGRSGHGDPLECALRARTRTERGRTQMDKAMKTRIALIAHDMKKDQMVELAGQHVDTLRQCDLVATGTTGQLLI